MNKCGKCAHKKVCYLKIIQDNDRLQYGEEADLPEEYEECGYFEDSDPSKGAVCAICRHRHSDMSSGKLISRCDILNIRFKDMFGFGCRKFEEKRSGNDNGYNYSGNT